MDASCIRQTTLPHTSKLFEDFSYHFDRVAQFYPHNPHYPESYKRAAAELNYPDDRRAALVAALRKQNGDSPSLHRLAQPGTVAVVTGQQVGLFSGPSYTIYKALTAARLAEQLTAAGVPAVPVFWLATEDHDLAEVDHVSTFDGSHQPVTLHASSQGGGAERPVGDIAFEGVPLHRLRECIGGFPFAEEVLAHVEAAYQPGTTFGKAFHNLLKRLLGKYGLLFVDPLASDIRAIGAPLLAKAAENAPDLKQRLAERDKELAAAGYHSQVHIEPQTSLLFLFEDGRRVGLKMQNGHYVSSRDGKFTAAQLAARAEHLSPNALLRPVMQDYLFPTVAYAGGPAELAYLAQSRVLYDELLGRMPVALHRAGFTILDARAQKLITRYKLDWPAIYTGEEGIREVIAQRLVPDSVRQAFDETQSDAKASLDRLTRTLNNFDPTLVAALDKGRAKIEYQLQKVQHKVGRETLRRSERAEEEARFLAGLLYPHKHLQERLYTILPFLAKHGLDLTDRVYERISLDCPDHQVIVV